jgi:hypothetical protein
MKRLSGYDSKKSWRVVTQPLRLFCALYVPKGFICRRNKRYVLDFDHGYFWFRDAASLLRILSPRPRNAVTNADWLLTAPAIHLNSSKLH